MLGITLLVYFIKISHTSHKNVLIESFHLVGHTNRFRLQENELSSVITQTVPLECTHKRAFI